MIMYRKRFGLTGHPLPKGAHGKTFYEKIPGYVRLKSQFQQLIDEPGLGVLTADVGMGKTASIRNLCLQLPQPDFRVIYLCDTAVSPLDLCRTLATELGVRPSHRRAQLWTDIKQTLIHMADERGTAPVLIIDEAHRLPDSLLLDLSSFLNFAFDSRDLLTLWLVGLPLLARRLRMQQYAALAMRTDAQVHLDSLDRESFLALIDHGLKVAGANSNILSDPARELLFRASRGLPRMASRLLRTAMRYAHDRDHNFVDDHMMELALQALVPIAVTP
jgi:MSHA biogenesis protein MshM